MVSMLVSGVGLLQATMPTTRKTTANTMINIFRGNLSILFIIIHPPYLLIMSHNLFIIFEILIGGINHDYLNR